MNNRELVNVFDYEAAAQKSLPKMAFDYYSSGANDEITLKDNHAAYERIRLKPRVLKDISQWDTGITLYDEPVSMPILVAPTAFHRMAHPEGEVAVARAAGKAGTIMILSTLSTSSIEEVVAEATGPVWFQLYVYKDREATKSLIQRAEAAGCKAITLTVLGPDRLGIVREISRALAERNINVVEMDSQVDSAAMSGELLFKARIDAQIPESTDMDDLHDSLEEIANNMTLDIDLD